VDAGDGVGVALEKWLVKLDATLLDASDEVVVTDAAVGITAESVANAPTPVSANEAAGGGLPTNLAASRNC